ncbi:MAG: phosphopantothenoylcysteine decarboxylase [Limisphaera sp.]|nr:phosphopantothenoylcysteine decarboxylase [Limisphaera sp.]
MNCLVTAGPTWEPLDRVRRLTNLSTGRLGIELANALAEAGHRVTLLLGELATCSLPARAAELRRFTTTESLERLLQECSGTRFGAVFHAAAVSDYKPGTAWQIGPSGLRRPITAGKIPTELGPIWVELIPTPKLIASLRRWFPTAWLVGWKYVVDGNPQEAVAEARAQLARYQTDACVLNGPACGEAFAIVEHGGEPLWLADRTALCAELVRRCAGRGAAAV